MSRYSRDDPRSIFFSGSSSTPLRSYAGSDLLKRTAAGAPSSPNPSTSPTPSTSAATPPGGEPSGKPEPVVRIIPILYPAQPARLIGGTSSYGNAARPSPPDGPDGEADAPVKGSDAPTPSQPPAAAAAPAGPTATTGILKSPAAGQAPSGGTGTPSRVSFSARPTTNSKPTMAGPSGTGNGVHGRTLPLAKTSRSGGVEPPLAAPPVAESTASGPLHQADPTAGTGGSACRMQLALYGWRKKCLYALIFVLMVMIIVNLALTLWIMKVMEFSSVSDVPEIVFFLLLVKSNSWHKGNSNLKLTQS
uniref:Uncharacterized protein n=1 Tax=Anopheles coluzzii TaxID=1518534 RepID=A0A8W7PKC2_ANOCL